jgi:hypothetical protein
VSQGKSFAMSKLQNLAPGLEMTLLMINLTNSSDAVGVDTVEELFVVGNR